jgi:hypothetical protein
MLAVVAAQGFIDRLTMLGQLQTSVLAVLVVVVLGHLADQHQLLELQIRAAAGVVWLMEFLRLLVEPVALVL